MPKMTAWRWRGVLSAVTVTAAVALAPAASVPQAAASSGALSRGQATGGGRQAQATPDRRVCAPVARPGWASCLALARTDITGHRGVFGPHAAPAGYGPADLRSAYDLPSATAGRGATVALVDAYGDPNAEADLQVYRKQYGLPVCDTANGCFTKVNQEGKQGSYPAPNSDWAAEQSLDTDMVSAICPHCRILLVEARNASVASLGQAVDEAVALGARYVSNSYATSAEARSETGDDHFYDHPGVAVTASAGDNGYGVGYPAASPYVTAVGGTKLARDPGTPRGWTQTVWGSASGGEGTGSGCSAWEPKPSWQHDAGCARRTVADVSADADPGTGVAVYDSYQNQGWDEYGGTSVASPVIAATYALAGAPAAGSYPASYPYAAVLAGASSQLSDVTAGANGRCTPAYLCHGEPGYDGPTGLGTPAGTGAFAYRPSGTVSGTVTDAATGHPVAGAQVSVPGLSVTTARSGRYTLALPAGSYQLTATDYGYQAQTAQVAVTAKATTTHDFALAASPRVTVGGAITDGSGHGWPLYAKVTWADGAGHVGTAFTSPATGRFSLSLLADAGYTLRVTALYPGYEPATRTVTAGGSGLTEDFALAVNPLTCDAPGYRAATSGVTQPFGPGSAAAAAGRHPAYQGVMQSFAGTSRGAPPAGWTVRNVNLHYPGYAYRPGWVFGDPGHRGNHTGGTGGFAIVDSGHDGAHHYQDTYLTSPVTSMSGYRHPALQFATDLVPAVNSAATVQVSTDAGRTWSTVWRLAGVHGIVGPAEVVVALPQAARRGGVRVRFGYLGEWSQYWEIDNVFLGNRVCTEQAGGLVTGRVTSAATGSAINGATVASRAHPRQQAVTVATPGDHSIGGGFYWLFTTATGTQQFTASMTGYAPVTSTAHVTAGQVASLSFALTAAG